jgi:hypothetical protein
MSRSTRWRVLSSRRVVCSQRHRASHRSNCCCLALISPPTVPGENDGITSWFPTVPNMSLWTTLIGLVFPKHLPARAFPNKPNIWPFSSGTTRLHAIMEIIVKIRAGYDIAFQCPYSVPMVLMLTTHPSRDGDILSDQSMQFSPGVEARDFFDPYGNICTGSSRPRACSRPAANLSSRTAACRTRCAPQRNSGMSANYPMKLCRSYWPAGTATLKSSRTSPGPFLEGSRAAGSECRRSATTLATVSNSATTTLGETAPPPRGMTNGAVCVETSPTSQ